MLPRTLSPEILEKNDRREPGLLGDKSPRRSIAHVRAMSHDAFSPASVAALRGGASQSRVGSS